MFSDEAWAISSVRIGRAVARSATIGVAVLGDLRGVDVDVHDGGAGREGVEAAGHAVVEAGAERDDQVGALEGTDGRHGAVHAGHAEVVAIRVRERAAGGQRGDNGGIRDLDEVGEGVGGAGAHDAAAHVEHGSLGIGDRTGSRAHLLHVRLVRDAVARQVEGGRPGKVHLGDLRGLGDVHEDRAGATRAREVEGLGQTRGDLRGVRDEEGVLGDGHRCADDVGFLEGIGADQGCADLAGDHDDRDRVHAGVAQSRQHVGGAGAGRHDCAADLTGGQGVAFGGVARALLVTDKNVADGRRRQQRVVGRQNCAAGHTEHVGDAQGLEAGHDSLGSGHAGGVGGVAHHSSSQSLGPSQRKNPVRSGRCADAGNSACDPSSRYTAGIARPGTMTRARIPIPRTLSMPLPYLAWALRSSSSHCADLRALIAI